MNLIGQSVVRRFHECQSIQALVRVGEEYSCKRKMHNLHYSFAVAVKRTMHVVVGHQGSQEGLGSFQRCLLFCLSSLRSGLGSITCIITAWNWTAVDIFSWQSQAQVPDLSNACGNAMLRMTCAIKKNLAYLRTCRFSLCARCKFFVTYL